MEPLLKTEKKEAVGFFAGGRGGQLFLSGGEGQRA